MTALGVLHQILFVDVSPPASLFDSSLRHDVLSLSDVTPGLRLDLPVSGGLVEDDHHHARTLEDGVFCHLVAVSVRVTLVYQC